MLLNLLVVAYRPWYLSMTVTPILLTAVSGVLRVWIHAASGAHPAGGDHVRDSGGHVLPAQRRKLPLVSNRHSPGPCIRSAMSCIDRLGLEDSRLSHSTSQLNKYTQQVPVAVSHLPWERLTILEPDVCKGSHNPRMCPLPCACDLTHTYVYPPCMCAPSTQCVSFMRVCVPSMHRQWTSFGMSASTALYVFMYSVHYFVYKTKMTGKGQAGLQEMTSRLQPLLDQAADRNRFIFTVHEAGSTLE